MIKVLTGDALEQLKTLPGESVHCVVTSPPYWGLRDYSRCGCAIHSGVHPPGTIIGGNTGSVQEKQPDPLCPICHGTGRVEGMEQQLGLEPTPEQYIAKLVEVFHEVKRVLRKDGTCWVNMGDCYTGSGKGQWNDGEDDPKKNKTRGMKLDSGIVPKGLKPKDLVGLPWRLAFALQADGWFLRSDIIWSKPNPMPESVTDRPTKAHEYIFLLSKSPRYFYDQEAVRERSENPGKPRPFSKPGNNDRNDVGRIFEPSGGRNSRTVWEIPTQPYPEAHFATFPEELPRRCIKAGTSEKGCCSKCGAPWERIIEKTYPPKECFTKRNLPDDGLIRAGIRKDGIFKGSGQKVQNWKNEHPDKSLGWQPTCSCGIKETVPCVVLDPFAGSGTTGLVARSLGRKAILIELNPEYGKLIEKRAMSNVPDICEAFS